MRKIALVERAQVQDKNDVKAIFSLIFIILESFLSSTWVLSTTAMCRTLYNLHPFSFIVSLTQWIRVGSVEDQLLLLALETRFALFFRLIVILLKCTTLFISKFTFFVHYLLPILF